MRSRVFIGASAWLLGAVTATTGSMIAVSQLAHGLFGPQAQLLGSASDLDSDSGGQPAAQSSAAMPAPSATGHAAAAPTATASASPGNRSGAANSSGSTRLLQSPDGSVMAQCVPAGAYLLYWIPSQGFQADDVNRGPAAQASVTFRGAVSSVIVQVTCQGGNPVARLYWPSGGIGHDE